MGNFAISAHRLAGAANIAAGLRPQRHPTPDHPQDCQLTVLITMQIAVIDAPCSVS